MNVVRLYGRLIQSPDAPPSPAELVIEDESIAAIQTPVSGLPDDAPWIAPGLIDAHVHLLETGLLLLFAELTGCTSLRQVMERIADSLRRVGDSPVALAFNLDPDSLVERRYPRRLELDYLSPQRPLMVYRIDGHSASVNSAGLDLLAGRYLDGIEIGGDSKPTGTLRGPAYEAASVEFKRRLPPDIIREALALAGRQLAARGITACGALVGSDELTVPEWAVLIDALASLSIEAIPYLQSWNPEVAAEFGLHQTGGCLLLDGSFGSHTAALSEEYADSPGERGLLYRTDEQITSYINTSAGLGLQTAFHAIGDRAIEQLVRCHESAGSHTGHLRHRIEHAELLRHDLIQRAKENELVLVIQPAFEAFWGGPERMYSSRLGDRWRTTNAFRDLLSAGLRLAGSSDSPITPADPLSGIAAAVNLPNAAQRLGGNEAMALFTTGAAFALGIERKAGTIAVGRPADFVLLDRDPRAGRGGRLLETWRNGRRIYPHGR